MKLTNLMTMTALALVLAMPAMAETTHKMHKKMHHKVSETMVMGTGMKAKPEAQHVESTPDAMKDQSDGAKANGVGNDPNGTDPADAPR